MDQQKKYCFFPHTVYILVRETDVFKTQIKILKNIGQVCEVISWRGGSLMGFLELRQARGVYSRVTTGMPILNGSLFSEVRTLV